jgi:transglutaminase-like putative cysteine protease
LARYRIEHETVLEYPEPVREHHIELRLAPRECSYQRLRGRTVEVSPEATLRSYVDAFGNRVDCFCVIPPHDRLATRVVSEVENTLENPFQFLPGPPEGQEASLQEILFREPRLLDFVFHESALTPGAPRLAAILGEPAPARSPGVSYIEALVRLMDWVSGRMSYRGGTTPVHAPLADALALGAGVCQDFAHLFVSVARAWGLPARYVVGYLDGELLSGGTAATHAWAEVLVPVGGWIGFDASHRLLANDRYIPVAVGRDSYDAAPQRGSFKGAVQGETPLVRVVVAQQ